MGVGISHSPLSRKALYAPLAEPATETLFTNRLWVFMSIPTRPKGTPGFIFNSLSPTS